VHLEQDSIRDSKLNDIINKKFSCKTASEDDIKKRCLGIGKNDEEIDFAILVFRSGKKIKEIASELFVTTDAVKKRKARFKNELEAI